MSEFMLRYGDEAIPVVGDFPETGDCLPSFMLVDESKQDIALERFAGEPKVIVTLLSLDEEEHGGMDLLRKIRRDLAAWPMLRLIVISVDSPSSLQRARREHGLPGVVLLSTLRGRDFHKQYGVLAMGHPLSGYTAPAILIADANDRVYYAERLASTTGHFDMDAITALLLRESEAPASSGTEEDKPS